MKTPSGGARRRLRRVPPPIARWMMALPSGVLAQRRVDRWMQSAPPTTRDSVTRELEMFVDSHLRWRSTSQLTGHPTADEWSKYSQNGEDGILAAIVDRLGMSGGVVWEFGAADGAENCSRALLERSGWSGLWVEGDPELAARAELVTQELEVEVCCAFVDLEGLDAIVGGRNEPDILVIDLDGNDYWIWRALDIHPTVVVIEMNSSFGPDVEWVMPYHSSHRWNEDRRHGASLASYCRLGSSLGYTLVACDGSGVNAFFVRSDLVAGFPAAGDRAANFAPPLHRPPAGHPWPKRPIAGAAGSETLDSNVVVGLDLEGLTVLADQGANGLFAVVGELVNRSGVTVGEFGDNPVRVGYWWADTDAQLPGSRVAPPTEPRRALLLDVASPGVRVPFVITERNAPRDAMTRLQLSIVHENVTWAYHLDERRIWQLPTRRRGSSERIVSDFGSEDP